MLDRRHVLPGTSVMFLTAILAAALIAAGCGTEVTTEAGPATRGQVDAIPDPPPEPDLLARSAMPDVRPVLPHGFRRCDDLNAVGPITGPVSENPEIAAAQQWRANHGLRSDEEWVRQVPQMERTIPEAHAFEAPLTDDEVLDLVDRGSDVDFEALAAYQAEHQATFGGYWYDNVTRLPTISFSSDIDQRRAEAAELLPGVQVVEANLSQDELGLLQNDLFELVTKQGLGTGAGTRINLDGGVVSLSLFVLDEATVNAVAELADPALTCLEGQEVAHYTAPGPQAVEGDGWRLLALREVDAELEAMFDRSRFEEVWAGFSSDEPVPEVNFDSEIVVAIPTRGLGVTNGPCGVRFDGWSVADGVLRLDMPSPGGATDCDAAYHPGAFLVALQPEGLPPGPVMVEVVSRSFNEPIMSGIFDR